MKADPFPIGHVLRDPQRFIVPIYQRTYSWTVKRQLERFFDTLEAKARERLESNGRALPHYMGALLLSPRGQFSFGSIPVLDVVDGQQRLMTFQILLAAVRDLAIERKQSHLADQLGTFLFNAPNPLMKDAKIERFKLQATAYDRDLMRAITEGNRDGLRKRYPTHFHKNGNIRTGAPLPLAAWWYLRDEAEEFIQADDATAVMGRLDALSRAVLEDFRVIVITLEDADDAQVIFETLNSGGEPLAAMDLVRNDVFHRAIRGDEDPDTLMERQWSVFEQPFWKQEATQGRLKKPRIDFFLAHTLTSETGEEVQLSELYARYKALVAGKQFPSVEAELQMLTKHAPAYRSLVEPDPETALGSLGRTLNVFDVSTAYPFIFFLAVSGVADSELQIFYRFIASYVVRRALCGLTPKGFNKTFARMTAQLRAVGVTHSAFVDAMTENTSDTTRFPTDEEFRDAILLRPQYNAIPTSRLAYVLKQLELCSRDKFDETVGLREDLTIEHILPNKWAEHWPLPDGSRAPEDYIAAADDPRRAVILNREKKKHTLGNLTLLTPSGNPRLGNLPFQVLDPAVALSKQEALRGSLLKMNQEIAASSEWGEAQIDARGELLARRAIRLWPYPREE